MDKRPLLLMPADEFFILLCRFFGKYASYNLDPGISQLLKTTPGNQRIRIFNRSDDPRDPRIDQSLCARRRLTVMRMRLERHIRSSAACTFAGLLKSDHFGVRDVVVKITSLANDLPVSGNDNASDKRIRRYKSNALGSECECPSCHGQNRICICLFQY